MADGAVIAARILENDGEPFGTLSLANGLPTVTINTAVADARRNYMRLAALIHPDKIKGEYERATEAFQCLVRAFETFVDPKLRKRAAAALEKVTKQNSSSSVLENTGKLIKASKSKKVRERKARGKSSTTVKVKDVKSEVKEEATKHKKKDKQTDNESEDNFVEDDSEYDDDEEEEEEGEEGEGEDDWEDKFLADEIEPAVSTSRTPIGAPRTGGVYTQTIIGCPNCRTKWEPDSKPQYSLFMGKWGKKVHCQLCLFVFGSASALHNCPHCNSAFDYDASMYDNTITCAGCKREIGFPYYPVNQMLIDNLALEQWRERKEAAKVKEREMRARQRHGLGMFHKNTTNTTTNGNSSSSKQTSKSGRVKQAAEDEDAMLTLVGTCVVEDECPLCHQRVKRNHRTHVEECIKLTPEERANAKHSSNKSDNKKFNKTSVRAKSNADNDNNGNINNTKELQNTRKRGRSTSKPIEKCSVEQSDHKEEVINTKAKRTAATVSTKSSSESKNTRNTRSRKRRRSGDDDDDESESEFEEDDDEDSESDDDDEDDEDEEEEEEFSESDDESDDN